MNQAANKRWLLPDGVQETLPPDAAEVELLRHQILTIFQQWGYDLVMPAMIEYMDSLLTGTAHSLDTITFSLVDQLSGKQMGVRSDMTPQVARIGEGITASRTPLQIGAEIFGSESVSADIEIVSLMIAMLHKTGLSSISIDIGHVGIFRSLVKNTELDEAQENRLFDMLQRKSIPDLHIYLQELPLDEQQREHFRQLALLNGDVSIIDEARVIYADASADLFAALDEMHHIVNALQARYPETLIHCDLSELRGYSYHTGLVFAAFLPGQGAEIARGGRYDDVGSVFGNARPATGFSADLLNLYQLRGSGCPQRSSILAPDNADKELNELISDLRHSGERVVVDLTQGKNGAVDQQCDREIRNINNSWVVLEV